MTQYYPQQNGEFPPKKKKNKTRRIVLIVLVGILGMCLLGTIVTLTSLGQSDNITVQPENNKETEMSTDPELTTAQKQATGSAQNYLDIFNFSRKGLINQLELEGFSTEDAEFAVDYLDVDWMAQAVGSAENYLEFSNFSRQGLIEQLEFEGFTTKQAEHAATEVGL